MDIPNVKLSNGRQIPQVGLGLWKVKEPEEFKIAFGTAIEAGYRHFDSAQAYYNEHLLGQVWQESGLKREEFFITTKIAVQHFGYINAKRSFKESLSKLQTEYVDLLLLHFPVPILRKKTWQALEEIQAASGARAIGVSNYTIRHLEEMKDYAKVLPAVNQVELHVFLQQPELVKYCQDNGIVVEAYSPLAHARAMDNKTIADIANKHGKTYAQIMLRWCVQQDLVVLPKSVTPSRIKENIGIFDFRLDTEDMKTIAEQDQDLRTAWSPVHVP
ncbi:MAG TPA: aldo/keto reductase [Candidatus Dormibacteraeota bacterium]|nr:aldo/keto reductase [Candidatus Dormibacteraeota bacterium]